MVRASASGMPKVAVWQLDYDATNGVLAAGTHGRGAYTLTEPRRHGRHSSSPRPTPACRSGPGSTIDYTITVRNIGNAAATGVSITDPIPAHTTFASADHGGSLQRTDRHVERPDRSRPAAASR